VPQYEVNDWTLGVLYQLMSKNERLNSHSVCVREDLYQKAKEYKTEGVLLFSVVIQCCDAGFYAGSHVLL